MSKMKTLNTNPGNCKWVVVVAMITNGIPEPYSIEFYKTRKECRDLVKIYKRFGYIYHLCKVHTKEDGSIFFEKSH